MKQFPKDITSLVEVLKRLPQQKIAKTLSVILIVYIAYLCSQMTWLFATPTESKTVLSAVVSNGQSNKNDNHKIKVKEFLSLNVFGSYKSTPEAPKIVEVQPQNAPETRLNLTLAGTVASNGNTAAAIIENNGQQETYGIADKITGTQATVDQIFTDRVIIKVSGRLETLMLDGFEYNDEIKAVKQAATAPPKVKPGGKKRFNDQRSNKKLSETARNLRRDLSKDPGKITDYLKVSPRRLDGTIVGYQLRPGKDKAFFEAAGLKHGDIAIQMNGYDLSSPMEALQAMQALKQETEISLLVQRNGDVTEILFSIDN